MDELTLGLIGAGAVVVGGVVVYNAWQSAKVRRKMPRPMPDEAADALARQDADDEQPFIEPVRQSRREPVAGDADSADDSRAMRASSRASAARDIAAAGRTCGYGRRSSGRGDIRQWRRAKKPKSAVKMSAPNR